MGVYSQQAVFEITCGTGAQDHQKQCQSSKTPVYAGPKDQRLVLTFGNSHCPNIYPNTFQRVKWFKFFWFSSVVFNTNCFSGVFHAALYCEIMIISFFGYGIFLRSTKINAGPPKVHQCPECYFEDWTGIPNVARMGKVWVTCYEFKVCPLFCPQSQSGTASCSTLATLLYIEPGISGVILCFCTGSYAAAAGRRFLFTQ